jgi:hypothetical protein
MFLRLGFIGKWTQWYRVLRYRKGFGRFHSAVWAVAGARLKVRMHHGSNGSLEQTLGFASAFG